MNWTFLRTNNGTLVSVTTALDDDQSVACLFPDGLLMAWVVRPAVISNVDYKGVEL